MQNRKNHEKYLRRYVVESKVENAAKLYGWLATRRQYKKDSRKRVTKNISVESELTDREMNKLVTIGSLLDKKAIENSEMYAIEKCDVCRKDIVFNFEMMDHDSIDTLYCKKT